MPPIHNPNAVAKPMETIELHPLRDQPSLRVAGPGSVPRPGLEVSEIGGEQPLGLDPPALSLDESGEPQELPSQMPAQGGAALFVATLADAVVATAPTTPRAYLLSALGELVLESIDDAPNVWRRAEKDWRQLAQLGAAPVARPGEVALLGGQRSGYWHWWIDILPRVWLFDTHGPRRDASPLAMPPPPFAFQRESLDLLGLTPRLELLAPGLSRFDSVTFTRGLSGGGSRYPSRALGDYARWLRDRLRRAPTTRDPRGRRLFVSRGSAASRRVVNEAAIEPVLAEHGFEIVDCARLSIAEQFEMFSQASAVVGPHGAGLTNLLFSEPGTEVVEIFAAPAAQGVSNYRVLASHLELPYSRLLATAVPNKPHRGPHYYDLEVDPRLLGRVLGASPK